MTWTARVKPRPAASTCEPAQPARRFGTRQHNPMRSCRWRKGADGYGLRGQGMEPSSRTTVAAAIARVTTMTGMVGAQVQGLVHIDSASICSTNSPWENTRT